MELQDRRDQRSGCHKVLSAVEAEEEEEESDHLEEDEEAEGDKCILI